MFSDRDVLTLIIGKIDYIDDLVNLASTSKETYEIIREMILQDEIKKRYKIKYPCVDNLRRKKDNTKFKNNLYHSRERDKTLMYNYQKYAFSLSKIFKIPCKHTKKLFDMTEIPECKFDGSHKKDSKLICKKILWKNGIFSNTTVDNVLVQRNTINPIENISFQNVTLKKMFFLEPLKNSIFRNCNFLGLDKDISSDSYYSCFSGVLDFRNTIQGCINTVFDLCKLVNLKIAGLFKKCTFKNVLFEKCEFNTAVFEDCIFENCVFKDCSTNEVVFISTFRKTTFRGCDIFLTWFLPNVKSEGSFSILLKKFSLVNCTINYAFFFCLYETNLVISRYTQTYLDSAIPHITNIDKVMFYNIGWHYIKEKNTHFHTSSIFNS
jgi:uncharacterized protein YjbI with pentapeptide repeats